MKFVSTFVFHCIAVRRRSHHPFSFAAPKSIFHIDVTESVDSCVAFDISDNLLRFNYVLFCVQTKMHIIFISFQTKID